MASQTTVSPTELVRCPTLDTDDTPRVLFAKPLTNSDTCFSVSKGGRITLPRLAVETNLPAVANKKHNEVTCVADDGQRWTFIIKSWPNGAENKRVYVMERAAPYMKHVRAKVGDVIAITRREDGKLGVECNTAAALQAAGSQGRSSNPTSLNAAAAIAAQRCLRNHTCSKPLGHAGFCDSGLKGATRHNALNGLAAAAATVSGHQMPPARLPGMPQHSPVSFPAERHRRGVQVQMPMYDDVPMGLLVAKRLTDSDILNGRVLLPRMAVEANLPEALDNSVTHMELTDDQGVAWRAMINMSDSRSGKRVFVLEHMGLFLRQRDLKSGDVLGIQRQSAEGYEIVINPPDAHRHAGSDGYHEAASAIGHSHLAADMALGDADAADSNRRQSSRRRRFKAGCEVNFARMLGGGSKSNGLVDPFQDSEDGTFFEDPLPPPPQRKAFAQSKESPIPFMTSPLGSAEKAQLVGNLQQRTATSPRQRGFSTGKHAPWQSQLSPEQQQQHDLLFKPDPINVSISPSPGAPGVSPRGSGIPGMQSMSPHATGYSSGSAGMGNLPGAGLQGFSGLQAAAASAGLMHGGPMGPMGALPFAMPPLGSGPSAVTTGASLGLNTSALAAAYAGGYQLGMGKAASAAATIGVPSTRLLPSSSLAMPSLAGRGSPMGFNPSSQPQTGYPTSQQQTGYATSSQQQTAFATSTQPPAAMAQPPTSLTGQLPFQFPGQPPGGFSPGKGANPSSSGFAAAALAKGFSNTLPFFPGLMPGGANSTDLASCKAFSGMLPFGSPTLSSSKAVEADASAAASGRRAPALHLGSGSATAALVTAGPSLTNPLSLHNGQLLNMQHGSMAAPGHTTGMLATYTTPFAAASLQAAPPEDSQHTAEASGGNSVAAAQPAVTTQAAESKPAQGEVTTVGFPPMPEPPQPPAPPQARPPSQRQTHAPARVLQGYPPTAAAQPRAGGQMSRRSAAARESAAAAATSPGGGGPSNVLVAKVLTNSDTHGRIILPRVAVEANLSFLVGYRSYSLSVVDCNGRQWDFVIKSWANGTEHRRVYVLEQALAYLRAFKLGVGDAVGICTDEHGQLTVESNTEAVRQATVRPTYGARPISHAPPAASARAEPVITGEPGRCTRNQYCTKQAGHSGFCSGPREPGSGGKSHSPSAEPDAAALQQPAVAVRLPEPVTQLSAVSAIQTEEIAVGHLATKRLTAEELAAGQVILPSAAVEANIPAAEGIPVIRLQLIDPRGHKYEVLLRCWDTAEGRTYLFERLGPLLHANAAREGWQFKLSRDQGYPMMVRIEPPARDERQVVQNQPRLSAAQLAGADLTCTRTQGCTKAAGHQGFCSGHKGFRRRDLGPGQHPPQRTTYVSAGYGTGGSQSEDEDSDYDIYSRPRLPTQRGGNRAVAAQQAAAARRQMSTDLGGRRASGEAPSFSSLGVSGLQGPTNALTEVMVTCGTLAGLYDISRGLIEHRLGHDGKLMTRQFTPAVFEEQAGLGTGDPNSWRSNIIAQAGVMRIPVGQWLLQQGIRVDSQGKELPASAALRHGVPMEVQTNKRTIALVGSGRANSVPLKRKTSMDPPFGFGPRGVHVPKKARTSKIGVRRANSMMTQEEEDSLAADVLMSLGNNPTGTGVESEANDAEAAVESPAPKAAAALSAQQAPASTAASSLAARAAAALHRDSDDLDLALGVATAPGQATQLNNAAGSIAAAAAAAVSDVQGANLESAMGGLAGVPVLGSPTASRTGSAAARIKGGAMVPPLFMPVNSDEPQSKVETTADRVQSLDVPLVNARVPGVLSMDPAGSAVLDNVLPGSIVGPSGFIGS